MTALLHKAKVFLSDKKVTIAIIAVAIIARTIQLIFFYNIRVDGMYQVMAMQNFVHGHGVSLGKVLASDLATPVYQPLINWPPGYSLLLSPFYILFGHNYIAAGLTVDIMAAVTLIFVCRRILKLLEIPLYLINLSTLITGFFIYYFYFVASSDAVAITFFAIAIYYAFKIFKQKKSGVKTFAIICVCLFLAGLIKYLFIPVIFIVPAFIFLKGMADKNITIRKIGAYSFILLALSIGALLLYQKSISGSVGYISEPTRGFYPENLKVAWPAYPASFINPETVGIFSTSLQTIVFRIFQFIHIVIFAGLLLFVLRRILRNGFKNISATGSFFYLTFFISAGISLLLLVLSLRVAKEENIPGHWWTYVEDPRYYGLVAVLLHLGVFILYQYYTAKRSIRLKYSIIGLILLLLPEAFRGIMFLSNRITRYNKEEYSWRYEESIQQYANSIIEKEKRKQTGTNIVVTGSSYYFYYRVCLYSHLTALPDIDKINDLSSLNTTKPTTLLIILQKKDLSVYKPFLDSPEKELAGEFRGFYFYITHVSPH